MIRQESLVMSADEVAAYSQELTILINSQQRVIEVLRLADQITSILPTKTGCTVMSLGVLFGIKAIPLENVLDIYQHFFTHLDRQLKLHQQRIDHVPDSSQLATILNQPHDGILIIKESSLGAEHGLHAMAAIPSYNLHRDPQSGQLICDPTYIGIDAEMQENSGLLTFNRNWLTGKSQTNKNWVIALIYSNHKASR